MVGASVSEPSNPPAIVPPSTSHARSERARRAAKAPRQTSAKSAARDIVIASRAAGMSIAECAKAAGVSETTASAYVNAAAKGMTDMSREGIISMLSLRLRQNDTQTQYIAPLVAILSKLKGWTDKAADVERPKPMGELFAAWRAELAREAGDVPRGTLDTPNVGAPTSSAELTPSGAESGEAKAGEPPVACVDESVKSSLPPREKF